jgi:hypothetical protein
MSISVEGTTSGKPERTRNQQASPTLPFTRQMGRWAVDSRSIPLPPVDMSTLTTSSKPTLCMASSSLQHKTLACSTNANANADSRNSPRYNTSECDISKLKSARNDQARAWRVQNCRKTDLDDLDPVRRVPRRTPEFHLETPGVVFDGR